MPIGWILLLLCWYGLQQLWSRLNQKRPVAPFVAIGLQALGVAVAMVWLQSLLQYFFQPSVQTRSPHSLSLPYVAYGVVLIYLLIDRYLDRFRFRFGTITLAVVMALVVVSNQFLVIYKLGSGESDKEFRMLADWYRQNAKPGEKLLTTLPHIVGLYARPFEPYFVRTSTIEGDTLGEFLIHCYRQDITYVAWDSRIGLFTKDAYYSKWRMNRLATLKWPRNSGPFEFITQLKHTDRRYINLYRLRRAGLDDPSGETPENYQLP
jgi:hypothetical protein